MTRHRKFLKSEKAKTKLKGAKLPKGLNITKTDFKVKKIVIRDQIKDSSLVENGTIARSNIKDLLSKLQHHNSTNRNEGIHYLKEIITHYPQETSKHLSSIIQGVCQLSMDLEKDVRHECFKALNLVFSTQTLELISPFFSIVTSYLRCAMTHININIQEDSLLLLDCVLTHTPLIVAQYSDSILSCFLDMISKSRSENRLDRTLTMNLSRKSTSNKWRSRVLIRLLGILDAIIQSKRDTCKRIADENEQHIDCPLDDAMKFSAGQTAKLVVNQQIPFDFDNVDELHCSLVRKSLNQNCELPLLFRKSIDSVTTNLSNLMDEKDESRKIRKYVEYLMPLLIESWMEVRPSSINASSDFMHVNDQDIFITTEAALTLKNITAIIERLLTWMEIYDNDMNNSDLVEWFRKHYCKEFIAQFLVGFPYQQSGGSQGSKRASNVHSITRDVHNAGGQKCECQNLSICYIFWKIFHPTMDQSRNNIWKEKTISFVKDLLPHIGTQLPDICEKFIKVLHTILIENAREWKSIETTVSQLLLVTLDMARFGKFQKEIRTRILTVLCNIVLDPVLYSKYGWNKFADWLPTLPVMLCQPYISFHVIKTFSHLAKQQVPKFLEPLNSIRNAVLENLPTIQITGIDDQTKGKELIINLFYWLDECRNGIEYNKVEIIKPILELKELGYRPIN